MKVKEAKKNMMGARLIFLIILLSVFVIPVSAAEPRLVWEKDLDGKIFDIEVSPNYITVGAGGSAYLFDRWGDLIWEYKTYLNVTAVAISEKEDYVLAASKNGYIYVFELNGSVITKLTYSGDVTGFDLGKPTRDIANALFPYPDKGHFLGFGKIDGLGGKPVFMYRYSALTNQTDMIGLDIGTSNYTDPCDRTKVFKERTLDWGSDISVGAGAKTGKLFLGTVNSHCSTGNYTIVSTTSEKINLTTLFDFSKSDNSLAWQISSGEKADKVALFQNGSYVIVGSGKKISFYDNPSAEKQKPKIVVLANSIDYDLASDFLGFLGNKGFEVVRVTADDFNQSKGEKFIVILGGPEAPDGVGNITKQALSSSEQSFLKTKGNKKMYVKTNVWRKGQVVMVIAGSGREQTQAAQGENREDVNSRVKR